MVLHEFKGRNIIVVGFELEKQVETFEKFYNSLVKDGDFLNYELEIKKCNDNLFHIFKKMYLNDVNESINNKLKPFIGRFLRVYVYNQKDDNFLPYFNYKLFKYFLIVRIYRVF